VWGQRHAATLRAIEHESGIVRLAALVDPDAVRLETHSRALGVPGYADVADLLAREDLDAVCLCTPDPYHVQPALACLSLRLHVLVEKPLATSLADALRIADAAREADAVVTVGHILRHVPQYRAAWDAVQTGRLGELTHVFARRWSLVTSGQRIAGRATLAMFQAIHDLDIMRWLGGPVTRVHAEASSRQLAPFGVADSLVATLRFAGGAVGAVESSWALPRESAAALAQELDACGTAGRVRFSLSGEGIEVTAGGKVETPYLSLLGQTPQALRIELLNFIGAIRGREPLAVTVDDGVEAVRLADAVDRSLASGAPVELS
jgi:UDP-N-acetylglucosamine 3-dehydrogenase